jgi:hypothetical protein
LTATDRAADGATIELNHQLGRTAAAVDQFANCDAAIFPDGEKAVVVEENFEP